MLVIKLLKLLKNKKNSASKESTSSNNGSFPSDGKDNYNSSDSIRNTVRQTLVLDVFLPLVSYYILRSLHFSSVISLILSGIFPAFRVLFLGFKQRSIDALGILVLVGIVSGSLLGLITGSAKLVLIDGVLPTAVIGFTCLVSLFFKAPLMYYFALEFRGGKESVAGKELIGFLQYKSFKDTMRLITLVWGIALVLEAGIQIWIILNFSISVAKTTSNIMPIAFIAILFVWTYTMAKSKQSNRQNQPAEQNIKLI
jgi:hypothetical protein